MYVDRGTVCSVTEHTRAAPEAHAYVFGTQASEAAGHSPQITRLFLSRIATGRPWWLAKDAQFRRGARRLVANAALIEL
jgi:hypothetical protein